MLNDREFNQRIPVIGFANQRGKDEKSEDALPVSVTNVVLIAEQLPEVGCKVSDDSQVVAQQLDSSD